MRESGMLWEKQKKMHTKHTLNIICWRTFISTCSDPNLHTTEHFDATQLSRLCFSLQKNKNSYSNRHKRAKYMVFLPFDCNCIDCGWPSILNHHSYHMCHRFFFASKKRKSINTQINNKMYYQWNGKQLISLRMIGVAFLWYILRSPDDIDDSHCAITPVCVVHKASEAPQ